MLQQTICIFLRLPAGLFQKRPRLPSPHTAPPSAGTLHRSSCAAIVGCRSHLPPPALPPSYSPPKPPPRAHSFPPAPFAPNPLQHRNITCCPTLRRPPTPGIFPILKAFIKAPPIRLPPFPPLPPSLPPFPLPPSPCCVRALTSRISPRPLRYCCLPFPPLPPSPPPPPQHPPRASQLPPSPPGACVCVRAWVCACVVCVQPYLEAFIEVVQSCLCSSQVVDDGINQGGTLKHRIHIGSLKGSSLLLGGDGWRGGRGD